MDELKLGGQKGGVGLGAGKCPPEARPAEPAGLSSLPGVGQPGGRPCSAGGKPAWHWDPAGGLGLTARDRTHSLPFSRKLAPRAARLRRIFVQRESPVLPCACLSTPRPVPPVDWQVTVEVPLPRRLRGLYALPWAVMGMRADVVSGRGSGPSSAAGQRAALQGCSCPMQGGVGVGGWEGGVGDRGSF